MDIKATKPENIPEIVKIYDKARSFYKPEMKKILGVMGSNSGREIDKMNYPGLDAVELPSGQITFKQA